ncbi:uncharacterized protein BJ171DRAFT_235402 [Polychytrium aggregatum]|uniref:uncharacterized protein n=1 Tax=Polychytrium aggregatum TaxID=110093 RepID=UPI0022FEBEBC|nr:uncharacterized protein BJ171DRAFT_235402 [Polychytrium aggregatum]KAI9208146.1 hypothetical protein BJ171DRAFT_235402 [Polychytrium aggregatum]
MKFSVLSVLSVLSFVQTGVLADPTLSYLPVNTVYSFPYASSVNINTPSSSIKTLFLAIHGIAGDVETTFNNMVSLTSYDSSIAVIAPYFACDDSIPVQPKTLMFDCNGWQQGTPSTQLSSIYSFTVVDRLLQTARSSFSNLGQIYIVGNSAGGQFVQRYLGSSTVALSSKLNTAVSFVISAPGSYLYLDNHRVASKMSFKAISSACQPSSCTLSNSDFDSNYGSSASCSSYNSDKYGLDGLQLQSPPTYMSQFSGPSIVSQYLSQKTTYMVGDQDVSTSSVLDSSCAAVAQGQNRLQRALVFNRYIKLFFPQASSQLYVVSGCSHDEVCVFRSREFAASTNLNFLNLPSTANSWGAPSALGQSLLSVLFCTVAALFWMAVV